MEKSIEKVCTLQVEFWTHLTTVVPDLNFLDETGLKIHNAAQQADHYFAKLSKINSNHQVALDLYGRYMIEIRNHMQLGLQYKEQQVHNQDILFANDTSVIHISGGANKDQAGKILKTSKGLFNVFGYNKAEVIGHSVNLLMPTIYAKKHSEFLDRFFKTGREVIFGLEREVFALHRDGYCFPVNILIKSFPSLKEGIQYVGMLRPIATDYDYMITDQRGIVDSFTKGFNDLLNITPAIFKGKLPFCNA